MRSLITILMTALVLTICCSCYNPFVSGSKTPVSIGANSTQPIHLK
jgi:hypothetical protein